MRLLATQVSWTAPAQERPNLDRLAAPVNWRAANSRRSVTMGKRTGFSPSGDLNQIPGRRRTAHSLPPPPRLLPARVAILSNWPKERSYPIFSTKSAKPLTLTLSPRLLWWTAKLLWNATGRFCAASIRPTARWKWKRPARGLQKDSPCRQGRELPASLSRLANLAEWMMSPMSNGKTYTVPCGLDLAQNWRFPFYCLAPGHALERDSNP